MSRKRESNAGAGRSPKRHAPASKFIAEAFQEELAGESFPVTVSLQEELAGNEPGSPGSSTADMLNFHSRSGGSSMAAPPQRVATSRTRFPTIDPGNIIYDAPPPTAWRWQVR